MVWPYPTRDPSQFRRIDQGWDLQVPVGTPVLAVADGRVTYSHNAAGFGDPYPVLNLDSPVAINGRWYHAVYYGHTHPDVAEGVRVKEGDVIAHAAQVPGGNASNLPGWLELGFFPPAPGTSATQAGQDMHDLMIGAPVHGGSVDAEEAELMAAKDDILAAIKKVDDDLFDVKTYLGLRDDSIQKDNDGRVIDVQNAIDGRLDKIASDVKAIRTKTQA